MTFTREWYEKNMFADQLIGRVNTADDAIKAFESGDQAAVDAFKAEVEVMRSAIAGAKLRAICRPDQMKD